MKKLLLALFFLAFATCADAATCFWVGGTGLWSTSNTASWASGTGGTASTCAATGGIPKQAADTATFDPLSGGGTVTVDTTMNGATLTGLAAGTFTSGTLTFATNNPSMTFTGTFSISGAVTRTINCGTGTFTLTSNGTAWDAGTTTGLTLSCASATLNIVPAGTLAGITAFNGGGQTYGTLSFGPSVSGNALSLSNSGTTFTNFNITAPAMVVFNSATTITNAVNWSGSAANLIALQQPANFGVISVTLSAAGGTVNWASIRGLTFVTNSLSATNSFNLGSVTNVTPFGNPSGGVASGHIIGG